MKITLTLFVLVLVSSCVASSEFEAPEQNCVTNMVANTTYTAVKEMYVDETIQIQENLIIEGYVVSSDASGNFFNVLHFQDQAVQPTAGFQIEIEQRDSHLFFPEGSKIFIKLKGLYLGKSKSVYKIGGVFTSFGNASVGRLPATVLPQHIFVSCEEKKTLQPAQLRIEQLSENHVNTLVEIPSVEVLEDEMGSVFAEEREETERSLIDCDGNEITLLNSGFSDFQGEALPTGNGSIKGVLLRDKANYMLVIRSMNDIDFSQERCVVPEEVFTSDQVFISELADPNNNAKARFVELYNASNEAVSLGGWLLRRYTNDNLNMSSEIDLSGLMIAAESTLVISPNAVEFEQVYGFAPTLAVGRNSPADSNGDDNLELIDALGDIVDAFGIVGEDGSGTNHEFEDGRAVRKNTIKNANAVYSFEEWHIFNDTGEQGTTKLTQHAPENFTPGIHNE